MSWGIFKTEVSSTLKVIKFETRVYNYVKSKKISCGHIMNKYRFLPFFQLGVMYFGARSCMS